MNAFETVTQAPPRTQSASPWNMNQQPVNAFGSSQPMTMPKPKPAQGNAFADGFKAFAKGFAPDQVAASDETKKLGQNEQLTKSLAWLQQTAQLSPDQRAQFTLSNAEAIARDTGQPIEAVMQSAQDPGGFSDQALQQGIAGLSAQLGVSPEKAATPEPYTLAPGAQRYGADGRMVAENPRAERPETGFSLSPGGRRYDAQGNLIAEAPPGPDRNGITIGPDGTIRIGGPAQDGTQLTGPSKSEEGYYKDIGAYETAKRQRETLLNNLREARKMVGGLTAGLGGAVTGTIPGTPAVDLKERLATVQALIGFDALNEMRQNSPTGGALGQVTERELAFLQSVQGSLSTAQSPQQLREILGEVEQSIAKIAQAQDLAFEMEYQALSPGQTRSQPRKNDAGGFDIVPGAVEDGYRFKGGDPGDPNNWEPVQ